MLCVEFESRRVSLSLILPFSFIFFTEAHFLAQLGFAEKGFSLVLVQKKTNNS